jgi:uncharacterized protein (UPF0303 family)
MYAEMKHQALLNSGHSSAWCWLSARISGRENRFSGGSFPVFLQDGTLAASILVSGLHEGKDHEIIIRSVSEEFGIDDIPEFRKAMV